MNLLPEKIYLIDAKKELVSAWDDAFSEWDNVEAIHGDFFSTPADAMVSPANSFGYMDGGLDLAIRYELGDVVEQRTQQSILENHHGELPVGSALVIETGHEQWPYMICAPTMRIPKNISKTLNAYLAFRAVLQSVARFNGEAGLKKIDSLVVPGLGTGIGSLPAKKCAEQMEMAYSYATNPAKIPGFNEAHNMELTLIGE